MFENDEDVPNDVDNCVVKERTTMFGKHDLGMTYHLKPLLIRVKIKEIPVIKVFVDR